MTHESDTRLSENTGVDLYDRVLTAKNAGSSYIISLHLNVDLAQLKAQSYFIRTVIIVLN